MKLRAAARAFDKTACYDAYSGVFLFSSQLGLFDDTKRDSTTAERRIMSAREGVPLPARGVIRALDRYWIVGHAYPDAFSGEILRESYVVHEATALARIRTLAELVNDQPGIAAYAARSWIKNLTYSSHSSTMTPEYHIHFSTKETVSPGSAVEFGGRQYVSRTSIPGAAGTVFAVCDELAEPAVEIGSVVNGSYNVLTDSHSGTSASTRAVRIRWQSLFEYGNLAAPKFGPEDMAVILPSSLTVVAGARLTLSDGLWYVASSTPYKGATLCRVTRHV